jgi:hypothetical protein
MLVMDLYVFQAVRHAAAEWTSRNLRLLTIGFWSLAALNMISFALIFHLGDRAHPSTLQTVVGSIVTLQYIVKVVPVAFLLVDDVIRLFQWVGSKTIPSYNPDGISRKAFLTKGGLMAGAGLFGVFMYGILKGAHHYKINRITVKLPNLPDSLKGMKLVQISDIHAGSFWDKPAVEKGVSLIRGLKADMVVFTGDLVNNTADEMDEYKSVFSKISAPKGVYSILGNHDYGDYVPWPSEEAKKENMDQLKKTHADMGWKLLLDEHVMVGEGEDQLAVIGIENWGARGRFPKYGDLKKAAEGTENAKARILLSHDPSHWRAEVTEEYPDIDLTLSGHTHGMQFGVETAGFKWSPVKYMYPEWAGLYKEGKQMLYVNRGFGYLGYPGRFGIRPEITLITLS